MNYLYEITLILNILLKTRDLIIIKSVYNGVADFNYLLLEKVNRFINKTINVLLRMIYCLIFSILHIPFKRH